MGSGIEMIALNVGKGDATVIRCGDYTCLIDTGRYEARKALMNGLEFLDIHALDAVFLTHTHNDHTGGLRKIRKSEMPIGAIYASKYHPACSSKEHPAIKNAEKLGMKVQWLSAGQTVPLGKSGAVFHVLAPISCIHSSENDNSLVLMLESDDGRVLLTGDMEIKEQTALLHSGAALNCNVLKIPNHGDGDACDEKLIRAVKAQTAVISTNSREKPKTPDAQLLKLLEKYKCASFVTQESTIGIRITVKDGAVSAERIRTEKESGIMAIDRARAHLSKYGAENRIRELEQSSATVELAAQALGVEAARIAKTLSFMVNDTPILVVAAGDIRVDNRKFKDTFKVKAKMLTAEQAETLIGHAVGGVCPFGINEGVKVYLDESLKRFETVFPACGSANSAIELTIPELEQFSEYTQWVDVAKEPAV